MKKLEELGISPTPWNAQHNGRAGISYIVSDAREIQICNACKPNALITKAAPKMYECLREAVVEVCHMCNHCSGYPSYNCENTKTGCFVEKWRDVLDEAAGVEVER